MLSTLRSAFRNWMLRGRLERQLAESRGLIEPQRYLTNLNDEEKAFFFKECHLLKLQSLTVQKAREGYAVASERLRNFSAVIDGLFRNPKEYSERLAAYEAAARELQAELDKLTQTAVSYLEMLADNIDISGIKPEQQDAVELAAHAKRDEKTFMYLLKLMPARSPAACYFLGKCQLKAYHKQVQTERHTAVVTGSLINIELLNCAEHNILNALFSQPYSWDVAEQQYCHALFAWEFDNRISDDTRARHKYKAKADRIFTELAGEENYALARLMVLKQDAMLGDELTCFEDYMHLAKQDCIPAIVTISELVTRYITNVRCSYMSEKTDLQLLFESREGVLNAAIDILARGRYFGLSVVASFMEHVDEAHKKVLGAYPKFKAETIEFERKLSIAREQKLADVNLEKMEKDYQKMVAQLDSVDKWLILVADYKKQYNESYQNYFLVDVPLIDEQPQEPAQNICTGFYELCKRFVARLRRLLSCTNTVREEDYPLQQQPVEHFSHVPVGHQSQVPRR